MLLSPSFLFPHLNTLNTMILSDLFSVMGLVLIIFTNVIFLKGGVEGA